MRSYILKISIIIFSALSLNTCKNLYTGYNDLESRKYRLEKAKYHIDRSEFGNAIAQLYPVWVASKVEDEEVAYYYAIAHAGRAGLSVLDLVTDLGTSLSTETILEALSGIFEDAAEDENDDISEAIRIIDFTGENAVDRTARMNFLALFANWARIGIVIHRYAYSNNVLLSSSFDACKITSSLAASPTGIPDEAIDDIIISIPRIIDAATGVTGTGTAFESLLGSSFTGLTSAPTEPIPCSDDSDNVFCLAARTLINLGTDDSGIGLDTGNFIGNSGGTGACDDTYN